jgi:Type II secretion system (T2SS), protein M subtype b
MMRPDKHVQRMTAVALALVPLLLVAVLGARAWGDYWERQVRSFDSSLKILDRTAWIAAHAGEAKAMLEGTRMLLASNSTLLSGVSPVAQAESLQDYVKRHIEANKLGIENMQVTLPRGDKELDEVVLRLQVRGDQADLYLFITALENGRPILVIDSIDMAPANFGTVVVASSRVPVLAQIELHGFVGRPTL